MEGKVTVFKNQQLFLLEVKLSWLHGHLYQKFSHFTLSEQFIFQTGFIVYATDTIP